jgi:hypothetical protein
MKMVSSRTYLGNLVPCIPDWTRLFEVVHCVECTSEYRKPEEQARKGDCQQEEGPGEADYKTRGYRASGEGAPDTVVFDSPAG